MHLSAQKTHPCLNKVGLNIHLYFYLCKLLKDLLSLEQLWPLMTVTNQDYLCIFKWPVLLAFDYCHTRLELGFWIQAVLWWARVGPTHPPSSWICSFNIVLKSIGMLLKHLRILCSVPTLVWTSDQITSIGMCGVPHLLPLKHHRILCGAPLILKHLTS